MNHYIIPSVPRLPYYSPASPELKAQYETASVAQQAAVIAMLKAVFPSANIREDANWQRARFSFDSQGAYGLETYMTDNNYLQFTLTWGYSRYTKLTRRVKMTLQDGNYLMDKAKIDEIGGLFEKEIKKREAASLQAAQNQKAALAEQVVMFAVLKATLPEGTFTEFNEQEGTGKIMLQDGASYTAPQIHVAGERARLKNGAYAGGIEIKPELIPEFIALFKKNA